MIAKVKVFYRYIVVEPRSTRDIEMLFKLIVKVLVLPTTGTLTINLNSFFFTWESLTFITAIFLPPKAKVTLSHPKNINYNCYFLFQTSLYWTSASIWTDGGSSTLPSFFADASV